MSKITYEVYAHNGYGTELYEKFSSLEAAQAYVAENEDTPLHIRKVEEIS